MKPIAKSIRSRGFSSRSFEERRGWFIALGYLAGTGALPALQLQSEPFRGGSQVNEEVHLALLGIKATRSPDANAWLKEFADSTDGDLQLLTHKILSGRKGGRS
jgi:hypothetical protein